MLDEVVENHAAIERVTVVELQLWRWRRESYTDMDVAPHLVLEHTAFALARLHSKHIEDLKEHLQQLKNHIQYFLEDPTKLFAQRKREEETVKRETAECVPKLRVLADMLTPRSEGTPVAHEAV